MTAGPGQILLGRGTWSLVRDAAEVEPPRVLALPGRQACRVASAPRQGTTVELWLPRS